MAAVQRPLHRVEPAVDPRPRLPDHRGGTVEVGVDGRLLRLRRVPVRGEVDGQARHAQRRAHRVGMLRVSDALRVAAEHLLRLVLEDQADLQPGGEQRGQLGLLQVLPVRVVGRGRRGVPHHEPVPGRLDGRR